MKRLLSVLVIFTIFLIVGCEKKNKYRLIRVESTQGSTVITRGSETYDAFVSMQLIPGDTASVGEGSSLLLLVDSDKHICAEENTVFSVNATGSEKKGEATIEVIDGNALFTIDNKLSDSSSFIVKTPNATLSVRGTTFRVIFDKASGETTLEVTEGIVLTENKDGSSAREIGAGMSAKITGDTIIENPAKPEKPSASGAVSSAAVSAVSSAPAASAAQPESSAAQSVVSESSSSAVSAPEQSSVSVPVSVPASSVSVSVPAQSVPVSVPASSSTSVSSPAASSPTASSNPAPPAPVSKPTPPAPASKPTPPAPPSPASKPGP